MDVVAISSLSPSSSDASDRVFRGVVTLLWPYSSTTNQCALLIADADARRRYQKGQVRVRFTGPSAEAVAKSGIGIGDDVEIALAGSRWLTEADSTMIKTPGKSVDGELLFNRRLRVSTKRGDNEEKIIEVNEQSQPRSPKQSMLPPSTPASRPSARESSHYDAYGVPVYSSPAFMKRLRLSEGRTSYTPVSEDDDLDTEVSRKRRRVSYKNVVEWKFDTREPSPEKDQAPVQDEEIEDVMDVAELTATPTTKPSALQRPVGDLSNANEALAIPAIEGPNIEESSSAFSQAYQDMTGEDSPDEPSAQDLESDQRAPNSALASQLDGQASSDMSPPSLPRLQIPSASLDSSQQPYLIEEEKNRPTTPVLQPTSAKNLPLPSPFPTSAKQMPPSSIFNTFAAVKTTQSPSMTHEGVSQLSESKREHSEIKDSEATSKQEDTLDGNFDAEKSDGNDSDLDDAGSEVEKSQSLIGSSGTSVDGDVVSQQPRRHYSEDATPNDKMDSEDDSLQSESSESEDSDTQYIEQELMELQESDQEEIAEEPDWDLLAHQLRDEIDEDALERVEGEDEDQPDTLDKMRHDNGSDLDELDDDRSDDAIDEEDQPNISESPDPELNLWPASDNESSDVSEGESFASQTAIPDPPYPPHPFGFDGAFFSKESVDENHEESVPVGRSNDEALPKDEAEAWSDRDAALQVINQSFDKPTSTEERSAAATTIPQTSSSAKVTLFELPSGSDENEDKDEEEGEDEEDALASVKDETEQPQILLQQPGAVDIHVETGGSKYEADDLVMYEATRESDEAKEDRPIPIQDHDVLQEFEEQPQPSSFVGSPAVENDEETSEPEIYVAGNFPIARPDSPPKTSVEVNDKMIDPALLEDMQTEESILGTDPVTAEEGADEVRPATSNSFTTIIAASTRSPYPIENQTFQPIEKTDLSQADPELFIPSSSKLRQHPTVESTRDSVDESVSELVLGSNRASSRLASPAAEAENFLIPSQELEATSSQLHRPTTTLNDFSTSQMPITAEDGPLVDDLRSQSQERQAAVDDALLADFLETSSHPERDEDSQEVSLQPDEQGKGAQEDDVMQDVPPQQVDAVTLESESVVPPDVPAATLVSEQDTSQSRREVSPVSIPPFEIKKEPLRVEGNESPKIVGEVEQRLQKPTLPESAQPAVSGEDTADTAQNEVAAQRKDLVNFAGITEEAMPMQVTDKEVKQDNETEGSMTRRRSEGARSGLRRSVHGRSGEVPAVISEWFTPRRPSGFTKPSPERVIEDETKKTSAESPPRSPRKSPVRSLVKSPVRSPVKSPAEPPSKSPQKVRAKEPSISPPPIHRFASQGTSTSLSYFTPLTALPSLLNQPTTVDVLAISTSASASPQQAKHGPKDFYTTFHLLDPSLHTYNVAQGVHGKGKDTLVEVFRPFKMSLPECWTGDVVLLRGFAVKSRRGSLRLQSTASSGWCVWRHADTGLDYGGGNGEEKPVWAKKVEESVREEIRGPPVEVGEGERKEAEKVRNWWVGLKEEDDDDERRIEPEEEARV